MYIKKHNYQPAFNKLGCRRDKRQHGPKGLVVAIWAYSKVDARTNLK